jgi:hypothetical protein
MTGCARLPWLALAAHTLRDVSEFAHAPRTCRVGRHGPLDHDEFTRLLGELLRIDSRYAHAVGPARPHNDRDRPRRPLSRDSAARSPSAIRSAMPLGPPWCSGSSVRSCHPHGRGTRCNRHLFAFSIETSQLYHTSWLDGNACDRLDASCSAPGSIRGISSHTRRVAIAAVVAAPGGSAWREAV